MGDHMDELVRNGSVARWVVVFGVAVVEWCVVLQWWSGVWCSVVEECVVFSGGGVCGVQWWRSVWCSVVEYSKSPPTE